MNVTLKTSTEVIPFIMNHGGNAPNVSMIEMMEKSQLVQYRAWMEDGEIKGLRIFMRVINPFRRAMGFAMIEDYSNGYDIQPETETPIESA